MTEYALNSFGSASKRTVRTFATKAEALAYAEQIAAYMEEDQDNPGCFDIFTRGGDVVCLEPVSWRIEP